MPILLKTLSDEEKAGLHQFEDSIRLDSLPVREALLLPRFIDCYVVGAGIWKYLPGLRLRGFKDMYQITGNNPELFQDRMNEVWRKEARRHNNPENSMLMMYSYIDYVLKDAGGALLIFLPETNWLFAEGEQGLGGPTYDEVFRAISRTAEFYEQIHFVTGLYELNPKEFNSQRSK